MKKKPIIIFFLIAVAIVVIYVSVLSNYKQSIKNNNKYKYKTEQITKYKTGNPIHLKLLLYLDNVLVQKLNMKFIGLIKNNINIQ